MWTIETEFKHLCFMSFRKNRHHFYMTYTDEKTRVMQAQQKMGECSSQSFKYQSAISADYIDFLMKQTGVNSSASCHEKFDNLDKEVAFLVNQCETNEKHVTKVNSNMESLMNGI